MDERVTQLGYLGFAVRDMQEWSKFCVDVLGLELATNTPDLLAFRMDNYERRILVLPGDDDLAFVGWQVASHEALDTIVVRLRAAGVDVVGGSAEDAARRAVERVVSFCDPAGNPIELFCGPSLAESGFSSARVPAGFVAGDLGLGHIVLTSNDNHEHTVFYCDLLGLRKSDFIVADLGGFKVDIVFLHANARHHSLAFGGRQQRRMHHFSIQLVDLDDFGRMFDRASRCDYKLVTNIGRHPNDRMLSFYLCTPSGFEVEIGWGGITIDDADWCSCTYDRTSLWGHRHL